MTTHYFPLLLVAFSAGLTAQTITVAETVTVPNSQFDQVRLSPALAVHRQFGDLTLGEGEMIRDGVYTFIGTFAHEGSNDHRLLHSATASFNSDRWGFGSGSQVTYRCALPAQNHLETAFGFSPDSVFQYHDLKTEADKRKVLDLYFQSFAEHRISPYDPTPLDPIRVKFLPEEDPPSAQVDFTAFDRAMSEAVSRFHFTGFRLNVEGMGGGTFHARYPPKIGEFTEETPEYQAMFSSYAGQLESHLRERGWLDMTYVYWFDEPEPDDFDFVAQGMRSLKTYAPGLRRMLTEEPGDNVLSGLVDIWCPVSFQYDHVTAETRRAHNERFWWYVCTGPKAPYCTLFIDHPATELRTWHWQTWQREIVGTLVWQTNYWTSRWRLHPT